MDLLKEYEEGNSEVETEENKQNEEDKKNNGSLTEQKEAIEISATNAVTCAPEVDTHDLEVKNYKERFQNIGNKIMFLENEFHKITTKPEQGPAITKNYNFLKNAYNNHFTGNAETTFLNTSVFDYQYNNFNQFGVTENPSLRHFHKQQYTYVPPPNRLFDVTPEFKSENASTVPKNKKQKTDENNYNPKTYVGPFGDAQPVDKKKAKKEKTENEKIKQLENEQIEEIKEKHKIELKFFPSSNFEDAEKKSILKGKTTLFDDNVVSTFHLNKQKDELGKSWFELPAEYKEKDFVTEENFPPKKQIHEYKDHTMGVQRIQFLPKYGNYLLSASLDHTIKLWGVYKSKKCVRTYNGHFRGVKDIRFDKEGTNFISCGYDNNVIYWDTEYGKIKGIYNQKKNPFCLCLNPEDPNVCLVGGAANKVFQYDLRTGNIELEYNEHLQSINTVTLCENNKKLITTSDDKKIFIWEYGLPVVVKYISDPAMFSITAVSVHPNNNFFLCQSMDNRITVYEATGKFRLFSKKVFRGHHNAGYAINVSCSNDGKYVISGDSNGSLFIWNWKKMSNFKSIKAHKNVCIDCAWHPFKTSLLATASWDSTIKLWE